MISTRDLSLLPDVQRLRMAFQSMALLDAIIEPVWWLRYYSFRGEEPESPGISIGSMQNGSGDDLTAIFGQPECLIRGFAHEYPMTPYANDPPKVFPGVLDDMPPEFMVCRAVLHPDWWLNVTFCIWRKQDGDRWHHGKIEFPDHHRDPDGSEFLLSVYDGRPETYHAWAESYYDSRKFDLDAVRYAFEHRPLTEEIVRVLNPERSLEELAEEVQLIGYP